MYFDDDDPVSGDPIPGYGWRRRRPRRRFRPYFPFGKYPYGYPGAKYPPYGGSYGYGKPPYPPPYGKY